MMKENGKKQDQDWKGMGRSLLGALRSMRWRSRWARR